MGVRIRTTTGLTDLYVLFRVANIAVAATEGTGLGVGWYEATDANIAAQSLAAGVYDGAFLRGDWQSPNAADPEEGVFSDFAWNSKNSAQPVALFVPHDGNDTTSGTTLKAVVEAATAGMEIRIGAGIFDIGANKLTVPARVTLQGAGIGATKVVNSGLNMAVHLATRCLVEDMTIEAPSGWAIGAPSGGASFADSLVRRVFAKGGIDGFLLGQNSSSSARIEDSILEAGEDTVTILGVSGNHVLSLHDVVLRCTNSGFNAITIDSSQIVRGYNVTIHATSTGARAGGSAVLQLFDAKIYGGTASVVQQSTATVQLIDCEFDRGKASGTIIDIFSPLRPSVAFRTLGVAADGDLLEVNTLTGDVAGKVLGGGSGTIIGTGAWALNQGGQSIPDTTQIGELETSVMNAITTVLNRLGAWAGSGANNLLGAFRSLLRKDADATVPSDINADLGGGAGTANNTTDSNEALRDRGDVAWVTGSGGVVIPVNQVPVPSDRTWILKATSSGLRGELPIVRTLPESGLAYAIDFRNDLPNNGRLVSLDSISVISGPIGGIVISSNPNDLGVDRAQAKCKIDLVSVGTYEISCQVTYDDGAGGGISQGVVTLIVK